MTPNPPILEIKDLRAQRGGVAVLDIPGLAIMDNEVLSLIGPNGGGKSTLLLVLARLLPSTAGVLSFKGQPVQPGNGVIGYRRRVAMVFQEPLLFDDTVYDNVAAGLKIRAMGRNEIRRTVAECLDRFSIAHLADRHARKLSGGEAQRTSLARAFAVQPEIIFLDEPFSALDPPTREDMIGDLQKILRETGTTAVIATHDRVEALRLSDRIAVMKQGRIIQIGTPEEVMNHPNDEFIASFIGMETLVRGTVTTGKAGTVLIAVAGGRTIEAVGLWQEGEKVICCLRPEHVALSTNPPAGGTSVRNSYEGVITAIVPMGLFYKIGLDCGFPLTAYVTASSMERLALRENEPIYASFKATAVHVIR